MSEKLPTNYGSPTPAPLPSYGGDQPTYGGEPSADEQNLKMLMSSVPGTPGEDYPILSEVPETAFSCKGQKVGGNSPVPIVYSPIELTKACFFNIRCLIPTFLFYNRLESLTRHASNSKAYMSLLLKTVACRN